MANPIIPFEAVNDPDVIQSLSDIIIASMYENKSIESTFTIVPNVMTGLKIPVIYPMGKIGKPSRGCEPENDTAATTLNEKKWALKEWDFRVPQCYTDYIAALYAFGFKPNSEKPDLLGTALADLLTQLFSNAGDEMIKRFVWFGDTQAKNAGSSGIIKDGVETKYYTLLDGIWKQIATMTTEAKGIKKVEIAANGQASFDEQTNAEVDAYQILQDVIVSAPMALRAVSADRRIVRVTDKFMQKLKIQLLKEQIATESQFQIREDGIETLRLLGHMIETEPFWDKVIEEDLNNGTKWEAPYRVLYTTKDNLLIGLPEGGAMNDLNVWYDQKDRKVYFEGMGELDTKAVRSELISYAM